MMMARAALARTGDQPIVCARPALSSAAPGIPPRSHLPTLVGEIRVHLPRHRQRLPVQDSSRRTGRSRVPSQLSPSIGSPSGLHGRLAYTGFRRSPMNYATGTRRRGAALAISDDGSGRLLGGDVRSARECFDQRSAPCISSHVDRCGNQDSPAVIERRARTNRALHCRRGTNEPGITRLDGIA